MDTPDLDHLFLDAVEAIVLDALARIGDDPRARYAFFKRLLAVATSFSHSQLPRLPRLEARA